jgi:hypothetical protein
MIKKSEKLKIYEEFFHRIHTYQIAINNNKIREAISIIDGWSYAHSCGNGDISENDRKDLIEYQTERMRRF